MSQRTHSARRHVLTAALCALLLLVALGLMALHHAPWWALLGTQGALLVTTASAGMWLDRAEGERRRGDEAMRGPGDDWMRAWAEKRTWSGAFRYTLPRGDGCGLDGRREDDATPPRLPSWAQGDAAPQDGWSPQMWQRHGLPGVLRAADEDAVFWQERMGKPKEDESGR